MCKAHSKVTHIKQQKYFHHLKGRGYIRNSVLYHSRALEVMKIFLLFSMCHFAMGLKHCYKTTVFLHLFLLIMDSHFTFLESCYRAEVTPPPTYRFRDIHDNCALRRNNRRRNVLSCVVVFFLD